MNVKRSLYVLWSALLLSAALLASASAVSARGYGNFNQYGGCHGGWGDWNDWDWWDNSDGNYISASVKSTTSDSAQIRFTVDDPGTAYYVVVPRGAKAPSEEQILDGVNASDGDTPSDNTDVESGSDEFDITGLAAATDYTAYLLAENEDGDRSNVLPINFSTLSSSGSTGSGSTGSGSTGSGTSSPTLSGVSVSGTSSGWTLVHFRASNSGTAYYVVVPKWAAMPTKTQVKDGENAAGGDTPSDSTSVNANEDEEFDITNLAANTDYTAHLLLDAGGKLSDIVSVDFKTLASGTGGTGTGSTGSGSTGATLTAVSMSGITSSGATLNFTISAEGTAYFVVLPSGSAMPSAMQVKLGQNASGSTALVHKFGYASQGVNHMDFTGLSPSTSYVTYLTAQDIYGNLQSNVSSVTFMTSSGSNGTGSGDTTPPTITGASMTAITSTAATLNFTSNESGTGYFVVTLSGASAPTADQVYQGKDGSGATAAIKGSGSMVAGTNLMPVTGLSANTSYKLYFVAKDTAGNAQTSGLSVGFTTTGP